MQWGFFDNGNCIHSLFAFFENGSELQKSYHLTSLVLNSTMLFFTVIQYTGRQLEWSVIGALCVNAWSKAHACLVFKGLAQEFLWFIC